MMDIELIGREALNILKSKCDFPKSGFLAGGSLANTMWEIVSGNKAVINDVDIFILNKKLDIDDNYSGNSLFKYNEDNISYHENYNGIIKWDNNIGDFYVIRTSENIGLINYIRYDSTTNNQNFILNSFDINCTKVGYSIDLDELYWCDDFVEFLKTGELKVCNFTTPTHTSIRICKKAKELNAHLDEFEYRALSYIIRNPLDNNKSRFKKKYFDSFMDNEKLHEYFDIVRDYDTEIYIKERFNCDDNLYQLNPIKWNNDTLFTPSIFNTSKQFTFFIRNILGNDLKVYIWSKLYYSFKTSDYLDGEFDSEDIELLCRLFNNVPNCIDKLNGLTLSEQIKLVKGLLESFKDNPIVALCVLDKIKLDKDIILDDKTTLILELLVRKEIINDSKNIVDLVLNPVIQNF